MRGLIWFCDFAALGAKKEQKIAHFGASSEVWRTSDQRYQYCLGRDLLTYLLPPEVRGHTADKDIPVSISGCHWTFVPWSMNFLHSPSIKAEAPCTMNVTLQSSHVQQLSSYRKELKDAEILGST